MKNGTVRLALLLAAAVVLFWWPASKFQFLNYDDNEYVFENKSIREGLSLDGVKWAFNCGYAAMTKEKYDLIMDGSHEQKVPPEEILIDSLFSVFAIGKGQTFSWFNTVSQFGYDEKCASEIGHAGDTTFYLYMEGVNQDFIADIDPMYKDEYIAMASAWHEVAASFTFFEPQEQPDPYAHLRRTTLPS